MICSIKQENVLAIIAGTLLKNKLYNKSYFYLARIVVTICDMVLLSQSETPDKPAPTKSAASIDAGRS